MIRFDPTDISFEVADNGEVLLKVGSICVLVCYRPSEFEEFQNELKVWIDCIGRQIKKEYPDNEVKDVQ